MHLHYSNMQRHCACHKSLSSTSWSMVLVEDYFSGESSFMDHIYMCTCRKTFEERALSLFHVTDVHWAQSQANHACSEFCVYIIIIMIIMTCTQYAEACIQWLYCVTSIKQVARRGEGQWYYVYLASSHWFSNTFVIWPVILASSYLWYASSLAGTYYACAHDVGARAQDRKGINSLYSLNLKYGSHMNT